MFSVEDRDGLRARLLARAGADDAVTGAAFTGSYAAGSGDRWSDTDLVLAVRGDLAATLESWTVWMYDGLGAVHHWDLPVGTGTVRVFLLPDWLEADITFAPEAEFAPRGPQWHTVFGRPGPLRPFREPDPGTLTGLVWHHALHARICLERGRWWQAEHWISALRDQTITLACLRLGLPGAYAKGAHLLPDEVTAPLAATLVREPTPGELHRAFRAALAAATGELARHAPAAPARLHAMLAELTP